MLEFTKTKPTKQGWYWMMANKNSTPIIVRIRKYKGNLLWGYRRIPRDYYWAGPLDPPTVIDTLNTTEWR